MAKILVIDRNEAFATMLKEMLEESGGHQVHVVAGGRDALSLLQREQFDLTIVDMDQGRGDVSYAILIKGVRRLHPRMRIVLIPLMGEDLPAEAHRLDIQGALSKPFFVDDLLPSIEDALSRTVRPSKAEPATADAPAETAAGAQNILSELSRETQADVVLLASLAGGSTRVLEHVSLLGGGRIQRFAELVAAIVQAGQAAATFLGEPDEPYGHNMFENQDSRLYLAALPGHRLIAVVTPIHTPLGTIRHNLRRASRELAGVE